MGAGSTCVWAVHMAGRFYRTGVGSTGVGTATACEVDEGSTTGCVRLYSVLDHLRTVLLHEYMHALSHAVPRTPRALRRDYFAFVV
jgi:hypothetical protein